MEEKELIAKIQEMRERFAAMSPEAQKRLREQIEAVEDTMIDLATLAVVHGYSLNDLRNLVSEE